MVLSLFGNLWTHVSISFACVGIYRGGSFKMAILSIKFDCKEQHLLYVLVGRCTDDL